MPNGWVIFLSIVGSLVTLLLGVIGFLMVRGIDAFQKGMEDLRNDIQGVWNWITADTEKTTLIRAEIKGIKERCSVLHKDGGRRAYDPEERIK